MTEATSSVEQSSSDTAAQRSATVTGSRSGPEPARRRIPIWMLAAVGALLGAGYAFLIEKMHFGPPLVMTALGGMTLALTAAALLRVIDPLAGNSPPSAVAARGARRPRELEREKQLVLKAIKEIELDYQMRKIAERDYREMIERYRTRALRLMTEIEAGDDFRALIEKELAMRLKLEAGKPTAAPASTPPATATASSVPTSSSCAACATVNDADALFCKKCGAKLAQS